VPARVHPRVHARCLSLRNRVVCLLAAMLAARIGSGGGARAWILQRAWSSGAAAAAAATAVEPAVPPRGFLAAGVSAGIKKRKVRLHQGARA
jgi:hypothetical protein